MTSLSKTNFLYLWLKICWMNCMCLDNLQNWLKGWLLSNRDEWTGHPKTSSKTSIWTLWMHGHTIWLIKCSWDISSSHEQDFCSPHEEIYFVFLWWQIDIQQELQGAPGTLTSGLTLLKEHTLFEKLSKCAFAVTQLEYLGHVISAQGVSVEPAKIHAIADWQTPASITQQEVSWDCLFITKDSSN